MLQPTTSTVHFGEEGDRRFEGLHHDPDAVLEAVFPTSENKRERRHAQSPFGLGSGTINRS
jgi:hypothetical protein